MVRAGRSFRLGASRSMLMIVLVRRVVMIGIVAVILFVVMFSRIYSGLLL
jgi:hypothetical protein